MFVCLVFFCCYLYPQLSATSRELYNSCITQKPTCITKPTCPSDPWPWKAQRCIVDDFSYLFIRIIEIAFHISFVCFCFCCFIFRVGLLVFVPNGSGCAPLLCSTIKSVELFLEIESSDDFHIGSFPLILIPFLCYK